jgi:mono/diheme cytochrome c family protein
MKFRKFMIVAGMGSSLLGLTGCDFKTLLSGHNENWNQYLRQVGASGSQPSDWGQALFALYDFGTLNNYTLKTNAEPWKLYSTALLISDANRLGLPMTESSIGPIMQSYGFMRPVRIDNWNNRAAPEPTLLYPLGFMRGLVHDQARAVELEVGNVSCAACHAGTNYDSRGLPTLSAVLGAPNTSINIEGYIQSIYRGLRSGLANEKTFADTIRTVYPQMSDREWLTIRKAVLPFAEKQLRQLIANGDAPLPFANGGPGLTNGVASLKFQVKDIDRSHFHANEAGFTSIPNLSDRAFRSSLLYDGVYAVPGEDRYREITASEANPERSKKLAQIVSFFTIPTAGNSFKNAERQIPKVEKVMNALSDYHAPAFPGRIDSQKALRGEAVYRQSCAECHGTYSEGIRNPRLLSFPNRLVQQESMGTEPARWDAISDSLVDRLNSSKSAPFSANILAKRVQGYVAPILSGLWMTAPYLHNGSVPTLWHFMHPESRPARFMVGGHRLDYTRMGLAGDLDAQGVYRDQSEYQPWSAPDLYDTATPGRSNKGHDSPFDRMSEDEKTDLLEYLKLL